MASTGSPPVARFGKKSEFGVVLDFIQYLVSDGVLRTTFDIPHLVVIGRQNMAKTTLINRLIGRYMLPMRKNESATHLKALTTYPIILNLRNGETRQVTITCRDIPDLGGEAVNPTDETVDSFLRQAAAKLPKVPGTEISKTPVEVTLQGPDLTTLTLVDLPGIHFANDDFRMNSATQELVLDYIEKNTKSIIVIVSEVGDPTGDGAINLVMKRAENFKKRTICVLTKPDKLRQTDDLGRKVALNESHFTLEDNRFILLRGKDGTDPKEKDWDCETTRDMEMKWFKDHKMYKDITHVCGIDRLMDTMISLLADTVVQEVPSLVMKMREKKRTVEKELRMLSKTVVPGTPDGNGALLMKLKQELIAKVKELLFNNISNKAGGEQVRELFLRFQTEVLTVDPIENRKDEEIKKLEKKLIGAEAALGDSSENNQLLQQLLYKDFSLDCDQGARSASALQSPVDKLLPICKRLVEGVETKVKQIVQSAVEETFDSFPQLKRAIENEVVWTLIDKKKRETVDFISQLIAMQKRSIDTVSVDVPVPSEISEMISTYSRLNKITPNVVTQMYSLSQRLHPNNLPQPHAPFHEAESIKKVKRKVVRCFNIIKLNVADAVPRCILHFLVNQLVDEMNVALETGNLVKHLKERKEIRDKRNRYRAQQQAIEQALLQAPDATSILLNIHKDLTD